MAKKETAAFGAAAQAPVRPDVNGSGFYIYIGPNLAGLLQSGTIFRGGRETALRQAAEAVKKRPLVKNLIVPGDMLPQARLKIKRPGNALYENYRRLMEKEG